MHHRCPAKEPRRLPAHISIPEHDAPGDCRAQLLRTEKPCIACRKARGKICQPLASPSASLEIPGAPQAVSAQVGMAQSPMPLRRGSGSRCSSVLNDLCRTPQTMLQGLYNKYKITAEYEQGKDPSERQRKTELSFSPRSSRTRAIHHWACPSCGRRQGLNSPVHFSTYFPDPAKRIWHGLRCRPQPSETDFPPWLQSSCIGSFKRIETLGQVRMPRKQPTEAARPEHFEPRYARGIGLREISVP